MYNNAVNRKGKTSGVQKRILDQNPLAFSYHATAIIYIMYQNSLPQSLLASDKHRKTMNQRVKSFTFKCLRVTLC